MNSSTAVTLYAHMALERVVDAAMSDVGRPYARKLDDLLDAVFAAEHERDPHREACPMCGGGLVQVQSDASRGEARPQGRKGWLSASLVAGMGIGAVATTLAAVGLNHYLKVRKRSRSDRLVALLRAQPARPIGELTTELYGADTPADRSKVRALLAQLGRLGKLRNVGHGRWEAIGDEEEEEDSDT